MSPAKRKTGLGRGLDALLSEPRKQPAASSVEPRANQDRRGAGAEHGASGESSRLPLAAIQANPQQPRKEFSEESLEELAQSIREQGVIQPIVVQPLPGRNDTYSILAGERRWRAAARAGLEDVPVVIRDPVRPAAALQLALVENLQRADLNPLEEAEAYRALREDHGLTQEQIASKVGKSRVTVTNQLRLLRLPAEVLDLLRDGSLSAGQARPLLRLADPQQQVEMARRAVERDSSAREVEAAVASRVAGHETTEKARTKQQKPQRSEDIHVRKARERLTRALQTKVEITTRRSGSGQVRIHFHSPEELMRLYDLLVRQQDESSAS